MIRTDEILQAEWPCLNGVGQSWRMLDEEGRKLSAEELDRRIFALDGRRVLLKHEPNPKDEHYVAIHLADTLQEVACVSKEQAPRVHGLIGEQPRLGVITEVGHKWMCIQPRGFEDAPAPVSDMTELTDDLLGNTCRVAFLPEDEQLCFQEYQTELWLDDVEAGLANREVRCRELPPFWEQMGRSLAAEDAAFCARVMPRLRKLAKQLPEEEHQWLKERLCRVHDAQKNGGLPGVMGQVMERQLQELWQRCTSGKDGALLRFAEKTMGADWPHSSAKLQQDILHQLKLWLGKQCRGNWTRCWDRPQELGSMVYYARVSRSSVYILYSYLLAMRLVSELLHGVNPLEQKEQEPRKVETIQPRRRSVTFNIDKVCARIRAIEAWRSETVAEGDITAQLQRMLSDESAGAEQLRGLLQARNRCQAGSDGLVATTLYNIIGELRLRGYLKAEPTVLAKAMCQGRLDDAVRKDISRGIQRQVSKVFGDEVGKLFELYFPLLGK